MFASFIDYKIQSKCKQGDSDVNSALKQNPVPALPTAQPALSHSRVATGYVSCDAESFSWEASKSRVAQCLHLSA